MTFKDLSERVNVEAIDKQRIRASNFIKPANFTLDIFWSDVVKEVK